MCYNYEDLVHSTRKRWKHDQPVENNYAVSDRPAVEGTGEKDESLYPGRKGRIILLGENETREGYFGLLSSWNKKFTDLRNANTFNARADSITLKRTWQGPWHKKQRCIIETTGFYEPDKIAKKKYFFTIPGVEYFYYGGLYNWWVNPENNDRLLTYAVITTDPNDTVSQYHNRMPWIVDQDIKQNWMNSAFELGELLKMMKPYPAFLMTAQEVVEAPRKKKKPEQTDLGF